MCSSFEESKPFEWSRHGDHIWCVDCSCGSKVCWPKNQQGKSWSSRGFQQSPILQELLEESKCSSEDLFGWRLKAWWKVDGPYCNLDSYSNGEQSLCPYRRRPCVYLLHNEEDQNQLDPHHQGTHAKGHEVKWLSLSICCFNL